MNASKTFLLGAAAGAAIALFFTSEKGKKIIYTLTQKYDDKVFEISENLKSKVDQADNYVKNGIDKATDKLLI